MGETPSPRGDGSELGSRFHSGRPALPRSTPDGATGPPLRGSRRDRSLATRCRAPDTGRGSLPANAGEAGGRSAIAADSAAVGGSEEGGRRRGTKKSGESEWGHNKGPIGPPGGTRHPGPRVCGPAHATRPPLRHPEHPVLRRRLQSHSVTAGFGNSLGAANPRPRPVLGTGQRALEPLGGGAAYSGPGPGASSGKRGGAAAGRGGPTTGWARFGARRARPRGQS